jgi:hypothetical protein
VVPWSAIQRFYTFLHLFTVRRCAGRLAVPDQSRPIRTNPILSEPQVNSDPAFHHSCAGDILFRGNTDQTRCGVDLVWPGRACIQRSGLSTHGPATLFTTGASTGPRSKAIPAGTSPFKSTTHRDKTARFPQTHLERVLRKSAERYKCHSIIPQFQLWNPKACLSPRQSGLEPATGNLQRLWVAAFPLNTEH